MPEERITREMDVVRWRDGVITREPDLVAEESEITFHVEPLGILDIIMAPESLNEFIVGHLFCEGLIRHRDDVGDISVADRGGRYEVLVELGSEIVKEAEKSGDLDGAHTRGLIQTECGAPPAWPTRPLQPIKGLLGVTGRNCSRGQGRSTMPSSYQGRASRSTKPSTWDVTQLWTRLSERL